MEDLFSLDENECFNYISTDLKTSDLFQKLRLGDDEDHDVVLPVSQLDANLFNDPFQVEIILGPSESAGDEVSYKVASQNLSQTTSQPEELSFPAWSSWDSFYGMKEPEHCCAALFTESNRDQVDAALRELALLDSDSPCVEENDLQQALFYVSMGRQSELFEFNNRRMCFFRTGQFRRLRIKGCGIDSVNGLVDYFLTGGSLLRRLKYTSAKIYDMSSTATAYLQDSVLIAFADCIDRTIGRVERFTESLGAKIRSNSLTTLELAHRMQRPFSIFTMFATILGCVDLSRPSRLSQVPTALRLLESIYEQALVFETSDPQLFELIKLIFQRTSRPWLSILESSIGLTSKDMFWYVQELTARTDGSDNQFFLQRDNETGLMKLEHAKVPVFLNEKLVNYILETVNTLIVLFHYGSPEQNMDLVGLEKIQLEWISEGSGLVEREIDVDNYERRFIEFIRGEHRGALRPPAKSLRKHNARLIQSTDNDWISDMEDMLQKLNKPLEPSDTVGGTKGQALDDVGDHVEEIYHEILSGSIQEKTIQVPFELIPQMCLDRIIRIQWTMTNRLLTQMLVEPGLQDIKSHALLIENTFFLRSGNLALGLEEVLFDRTFQDGLHMDIDRKWPLSSSATNRALSEMIEQHTRKLPGVCKELKDQSVVNIAIVGNSGGESNVIWATDILRLIYAVDRPVSYVLSSRLLKMCNKIFARLLHCLRIVHVMKSKQYWKREYAEVRNFVNCYTNYIHSVVIPGHWSQVHGYINDLNTTGSLQGLMNVFATAVQGIGHDLFINEDSIGKMIEKQIDVVFNKVLAGQSDVHAEVGRITWELKSASTRSTSQTSYRSHLLLTLSYSSFYT